MKKKMNKNDILHLKMYLNAGVIFFFKYCQKEVKNVKNPTDATNILTIFGNIYKLN